MPLPVDVQALTVYLPDSDGGGGGEDEQGTGPSTLTIVRAHLIERIYPAMRRPVLSTVAATMLRSGASMTEIGEVAGIDPNWRNLYQLDFDGLRSIGSPRGPALGSPDDVHSIRR